MPSKFGSRIWVRTSSFHHPVDSVAKLLQKHPYNGRLQLLLPLALSTVQAVSTASIYGFYYVTQISLSHLVDASFIQANISGASLYCACVDSNRRIAITPDGWLHIVVCKQQYHSLGLIGQQISGTGKSHQRGLLAWLH